MASKIEIVTQSYTTRSPCSSTRSAPGGSIALRFGGNPLLLGLLELIPNFNPILFAVFAAADFAWASNMRALREALLFRTTLLLFCDALFIWIPGKHTMTMSYCHDCSSPGTCRGPPRKQEKYLFLPHPIKSESCRYTHHCSPHPIFHHMQGQ